MPTNPESKLLANFGVRDDDRPDGRNATAGTTGVRPEISILDNDASALTRTMALPSDRFRSTKERIGHRQRTEYGEALPENPLA